MKAFTRLLAVLCVFVSAAGVGVVSPLNSVRAQNVTAKHSNVTLTFWHYFTDRAKLFNQFAAQYKKLTGVTVNMELVSGDVLGQKFQAAAQAHTLPDISAAWTGVGDGTAPYAKEGIIKNLQQPMSQGWSKEFVKAYLQSASFPKNNTFGVKPGPYLVPLDANNMQFLYNKTLFKQAGIKTTPKTYAELIADGNKLAKLGVAPFVSGFGSWPMDAYAQPYMWNVVGKANLIKTFDGKMKYTAKPWIDFLDIFAKMHNSQMLAQGILADDLPAAETLFVNGRAGMIFDGSWAIGVFQQQNPGFKNYGVFFPPSAGKYPLRIPGGVGAMVFVVGTSPHQAEAVKFLQWLTAPKQQAVYANSSNNLPANKHVVGHVHMTSNLTVFSKTMNKIIPSIPKGMLAAVDTTMDKGLQEILAGNATPQQVAALMQKAQETGLPQ
jgi:ABC-type glycerol-3-phosphate transport system substrate-binding protein